MANLQLSKTQISYEPIDASPVKDFFVSMLTRDITLTEAILDLLDNCIDGIHRTKGRLSGNKPYMGKKAILEINNEQFLIHDNCGGIPWNMHEYAFRMGKSKISDSKKTGMVGVYGIGMKRAIFKIGKNCLISTQNNSASYEVAITPDWIDDESNWFLKVDKAKKSMKEDGTTILISSFNDNISPLFGADIKNFVSDLKKEISTHYAFIIDKGFVIEINKEIVEPKPTQLVFSRKGNRNNISPFIYQTKNNDVNIFVTVGFTRPLPSTDEIEAEQKERQRSTLDAGWTVVCNDRVVLYCDRTIITGWGEAGVPNFHNQFIPISGIVEFHGPPEKLPTTTTKRGIEASSILYLQVKNKMREGMRLFIDYTNKWKDDLQTSKNHIKTGDLLTLENIKERANSLNFNAVRSGLLGKQFKPNLPMPINVNQKKKSIAFYRDVKEIKLVSEYLFAREDISTSKVGEGCFDKILKEAREQ